MSQRFEKNGIATKPYRQQNAPAWRGEEPQQMPVGQRLSNISTDAVKESVEEYIRRSPAKSLLIAVAAGLAIGWLVKR